MTIEEQIAELQHTISLQAHQIEILTSHLAQAQARIEDLQTKYDPEDHDRWFGYKLADRQGACDMFDIMWWEYASARPGGPKNLVIYFRNSMSKLVLESAETFKSFAHQFDGYLKRP